MTGALRAGVLAAGVGSLSVPAVAVADPGASAVRRDYLHSAVTFRGRAVDPLGHGIPRAPVSVVSMQLDGAGPVTIASATADARGWWRITAPNGPPRVLSVFAAGANVRVVRELVAPSIWFRATCRGAGRCVFRGKVWGPGGTRIVMRDRMSSGGWALFAVGQANSQGGFTIRYRAPRPLIGGTFTIRATSWPGPWRSGASRSRRVTIR